LKPYWGRRQRLTWTGSEPPKIPSTREFDFLWLRWRWSLQLSRWEVK